MPNATTITVIGNLTADVELTFTQAGVARAKFTVASAERVYDRTTQTWKDGAVMYLQCTAWRSQAENAAESLTKGTRAMVVGPLRQRSFETKEGEKRTVFEVEVEEVGPSLRFATAKVVKPGRTEGTAANAGWGAPVTQAPQPAAGSPWDVPAMAGAGAVNPPF
ncbi:single-stranded DNA-binding protein [Streptacidiphilus sp. N1-10]|uniref:Single-stranded DNA-binding protein n=1 Tax=Streptacidiphilus jeojiensis TaxID=3229225 RepID=A0ABV6XX78_9ACTN